MWGDNSCSTKFWQSYGPWHLEFLHILACLLNSSYILAWIWIKLGRDVAPTNLAGMLHHKSRSACGEIIHVRQILAELWSLTLRIFTHFSLSSQLLPTSLHGFESNLAGMLHHKSRSACGEIIHVRQILAELWSLTLRIFTHFSLSSQLLLHPCMDLNQTWQGCCTTSLEVHVWR